jgi:AcrR family transcriptional regulator
MTRVRNPRGHGQLLRDALLDAALRLLLKPITEEPLSLRAVAREAGVVPQSVYLHFADKEALVRAVVERCFAELLRAAEAAAESHGDAADRLRAWCLAYCQFGLAQPGQYALLFETRATGQMGLTFSESPGAAVYARLVALVEACIGDGDAFDAASTVWTAQHGIVTLRRTKPGFPWPPLERQVDRVLNGLVGISGEF